MKTKRTRSESDSAAHVAHELEGGAAGALTGAVVGAAAGPPGIVAGAVLGALAGTAAGAVLDNEAARQSARTRELDTEIGVTEGSLGAPNLQHPPAKIGAYSAASAGAASPSGHSAEGPAQIPEE
jgi:phage tail tape-measure protein